MPLYGKISLQMTRYNEISPARSLRCCMYVLHFAKFPILLMHHNSSNEKITVSLNRMNKSKRGISGESLDGCSSLQYEPKEMKAPSRMMVYFMSSQEKNIKPTEETTKRRNKWKKP